MNEMDFKSWDNLPNNKNTVDFLLDKLKDKPPEELYYNRVLVENFHNKAISLLSKLGNDHIDYLGSVAEKTEFLWLKFSLIDVLGNIGNKKAIQFLNNLVTEDNPQIMRSAILAIIQSKSQGLEALKKLLVDKRPTIRLFTLQNVCLYENKELIPIIEQSLSETDEKIINAAVFSLRQLGWEPKKGYSKIIKLLDECWLFDRVDENTIESIKIINVDFVPYLLLAIENDEGTFIVENSIKVLGRVKDKRAIDILIKFLSKDGNSISDDNHAITALGNIGDAGGFETCLRFIKYEMVSESAVQSLHKILISDTDNISDEQLTSIIKIKEVRKEKWTFINTLLGTRKERVDISNLKKLAKDELSRRKN